MVARLGVIMDWRDLIAWHQHAEALVTQAQPGLLRLCDQDPARIYLSISLNGVNNATGLYFITTNPSANASTGGLTIGQQWQGSLNNRLITQGFAGTFGDVASPNIPYSFTAAPGTGLFGTAPFELAIVLASSGTGLYDTPQLQPTMAPLRYEFWPDRHGILCQLPWFVWDDAGGAVFSVLTVRQERDPCDYIPGTTKPVPKRKAGACDPKQSLRSVMRTWHGSNAFGRGRNLFGGSVGIQRPQDKPTVQPDQYQSGLD